MALIRKQTWYELAKPDEVQKNARRVREIEEKYGGVAAEYITMVLTADLESSTRRLVNLTRWLIALTIAFAILTTAQMALIICMEIRS